MRQTLRRPREWCNRELARGTTWVFTATCNRMNEPQAQRPSADIFPRKVIYVVDDEPMLLELAMTILEPLGYTLQTFRDPESALRAYTSAQRRPDLLITDYAMHTSNGLDLVKACRRLQPHQKVLLLSGTVDESIFRDSPTKPDRFLAKPYQPRQLIELVQALVAD
jgi:two-component system, cell cycle sensor histidine kinase and response regulator CckA